MPRCLFLVPLLLWAAQPVAAASGHAGEFLALGAGARALALGSAYVALAEDATAAYWNPAGLARVQGRQVHLMHAERFAGLVDHEYLGLARQGRRLHGLALGLVRVGVGDIQLTELEDPGSPLGPDNRPVVAATTSSADYALYLAAGQRLGRRLYAGATLKGIYRTVASHTAYGAGLDLGVRYGLHPTVSLALVLRDVTGTPVAWDTQTTDWIRPSLLLGAAYSVDLGGGQATALLASRNGGDAGEGGDARPLNAGVEYSRRYVAVRGGWEEGRPAFGLGLQPRGGLELDVAYMQHDDLESTYQLSAGYRF
ncbi:MAG: hypothetical protein AB1505_21240 [Candidatus Latescibacterota bacterium]